MKIAVTYENGQVFPHFGHTQQFKVYKVAEGKIMSSAVVGTNGSGHGALAGFLKTLGVTDLICGGIGGGARMALDEAGIRLFGGVSGDADAAAAALAEGRLQFNPDASCDHHGHEGGHCGHHGHEDGSCGHHQGGSCGGHGHGSCGHHQ